MCRDDSASAALACYRRRMTETRDDREGERSVVGTVTIPADDPDLTLAKADVRAIFEESLERTARQLADWSGAAAAADGKDDQ